MIPAPGGGRRPEDGRGPGGVGGRRPGGAGGGRTPGASGFTLLEVLVALAILGTAVLATLQLLGGVSATSRKAQSYTEAMALAEAKMEELLGAGPEAILSADGEAARFPPPHGAYRFEVEGTRMAGRALVEVRVRVDWEGPDPGSLTLATRTLAAAGVASR